MKCELVSQFKLNPRSKVSKYKSRLRFAESEGVSYNQTFPIA